MGLFWDGHHFQAPYSPSLVYDNDMGIFIALISGDIVGLVTEAVKRVLASQAGPDAVKESPVLERAIDKVTRQVSPVNREPGKNSPKIVTIHL